MRVMVKGGNGGLLNQSAYVVLTTGLPVASEECRTDPTRFTGLYIEDSSMSVKMYRAPECDQVVTQRSSICAFPMLMVGEGLRGGGRGRGRSGLLVAIAKWGRTLQLRQLIHFSPRISFSQKQKKQ